MKVKAIVLFFLILSQAIGFSQSNYVIIKPGETEENIIRMAANIKPTDRQLRWQQLELTAFFHFGVNTFANQEWGTGKEDPQIFNPESLDAEQWVKTVKDAGFKQVIITAKHHDGFCLWPTKATKHSVKSSPWKNGNGDVVRDVANACTKYNIGFGVYVSPWDRNSQVYGTEAYNDFFVEQLTELLTQYGKVDEVWFDGANGEGPNGKKQVYDFVRWYKLIRQLQPEAVIAIMGPDVRWVGTETGMGREMEWSVVPSDNLDQASIAASSQKDITFKPMGDMMGSDLGSREKILKAKGLVWYPAETDVSIRPGWFYHKSEDEKVKTPKDLNDIYYTSVGMNSVLLLNIPPDKRGLIHENDVKHLQAWAEMRKQTFSHNYLRKAVIKSKNGINTKHLTDGNDATHFTTTGSDRVTSITFKLKGNSTFNVLALQENIRNGQRVEKFSAHYDNNGTWKKFAEGTTIGYKRLLRFDNIRTKKIRIDIESSRLNPNLAEVGLYLQPQIP